MTSGFSGFPVAALDFYDDLEVDNTRSFWEQHRAVYEESVRAPMLALTGALAPEFGEAKVFRPYRDVRFAKDKTPFKTHQGAFVAAGPSTGLLRRGLARAGCAPGPASTEPSRPRLAAFRAAVDHDLTGAAARGDRRRVARRGWDVGGDRLKTVAARLRRGPPAHRPAAPPVAVRRPLARLRAGDPPPELLDLVRADWQTLRPLVGWLAANCAARAEG